MDYEIWGFCCCNFGGVMVEEVGEVVGKLVGGAVCFGFYRIGEVIFDLFGGIGLLGFVVML